MHIWNKLEFLFLFQLIIWNVTAYNVSSVFWRHIRPPETQTMFLKKERLSHSLTNSSLNKAYIQDLRFPGWDSSWLWILNFPQSIRMQRLLPYRFHTSCENDPAVYSCLSKRWFSFIENLQHKTRIEANTPSWLSFPKNHRKMPRNKWKLEQRRTPSWHKEVSGRIEAFYTFN